jgi:hypothetical protein
MDWIPYREARFYQGEVIQRQSHHGDYACHCGGVAMSGGDGMDSNTQVLAISHVWVFVAMSHHVRHLMSPLTKVSALVVLAWCWKPLGATIRCPGMTWAGGMRRTGLIGDEILSAHDFRDRGNCWFGLLPDLVYFRLVVPHLQSIVVEPYPVRDA